MNTIEYALNAMNECERNDDAAGMRYWAAYLDGARAQKKEDEPSDARTHTRTSFMV